MYYELCVMGCSHPCPAWTMRGVLRKINKKNITFMYLLFHGKLLLKGIVSIRQCRHSQMQAQTCDKYRQESDKTGG